MTQYTQQQRDEAEEYLMLFGDGRTTVDDFLRRPPLVPLNRRLAKQLLTAPVRKRALTSSCVGQRIAFLREASPRKPT